MSAKLCLLCSSSLSFKSDTFRTQCCRQPICSGCLARSPRLARYNPCLVCLGGVDLVSPNKKLNLNANINGEVRDEDVFSIGDDIDDSPPAYTEDAEPVLEKSSVPERDSNGLIKYYITRADTLNGIALRFGVDARILCRENKLPPSILSTTPHLLHTRSFLLIPSSSESSSSTPRVMNPPSTESLRKQEKSRAALRLQALTREPDAAVAQAYVALANLDTEFSSLTASKEDPKAFGSKDPLNYGLTIYLDDQAWEKEERKAGRKAAIPTFPFVSGFSGANNRVKDQ